MAKKSLAADHEAAAQKASGTETPDASATPHLGDVEAAAQAASSTGAPDAGPAPDLGDILAQLPYRSSDPRRTKLAAMNARLTALAGIAAVGELLAHAAMSDDAGPVDPHTLMGAGFLVKQLAELAGSLNGVQSTAELQLRGEL